MADRVELVEVSPRDGLQNEPRRVATRDKIALIDTLAACGFRRIEATSFVSARWVPQLADAAEVMAGIARAPGVRYAALTPNPAGFEAAIENGADDVAVFTSASEGFCRRNINCTIAESIERFAPVLTRAKALGVPVRGYVSCVTDCPYDGRISPSQVVAVARQLDELGCFEISLGDTLGVGAPDRVAALLDAVTRDIPAERLAGHFHDTAGGALDNIRVGLDAGLRVFDTAAAGLGGCPYAPGAKGNVATEAVARMMAREGIETGIDLHRLQSQAVPLAQRLRSRA